MHNHEDEQNNSIFGSIKNKMWSFAYNFDPRKFFSKEK